MGAGGAEDKLARQLAAGGDQRPARLPPPARASVSACWRSRYGISVATGPLQWREPPAFHPAVSSTTGSAENAPAALRSASTEQYFAASGYQLIDALLYVLTLFATGPILTPSCAGSPTVTLCRRESSASQPH